MRKLIDCFMSQQSRAYQDNTKRSRRTAIAQVPAHWLISKAIQLRKQHIGVLLKAVRNVCGLDIKEQCDFSESLHSARMNLTIMSQYTILNIGQVYCL